MFRLGGESAVDRPDNLICGGKKDPSRSKKSCLGISLVRPGRRVTSPESESTFDEFRHPDGAEKKPAAIDEIYPKVLSQHGQQIVGLFATFRALAVLDCAAGTARRSTVRALSQQYLIA